MSKLTTDPRYVDADDERAVLCAWVNSMPMGGWTDGDEDAFRAAVVVELVEEAGLRVRKDDDYEGDEGAFVPEDIRINPVLKVDEDAEPEATAPLM